ncbi:Hypothetical Protein FCC1311_106932 [Hondaea fermentalgiana]|uniref:Uncharacterized protein n=1 Tax=Hondaea fermentalgiana TaxID=2315210 RepID=A0A2R5GVW4_9STRA|nr:Hypothetical Protein FCC1311_106932 [Hondaea fermentalgiana]|eukprot:GBG34469.1 Hypothetical Protein FCC1311_106932 [Hondaea fermentalgiana]
MVLGMAGLVALQLALLTGYTHDSATEVGLARPATVDAQDNRGANADRDDGDDNIDSLETLDGAYDAEGNDDLGSGDTEIEAENNGEADGDDGVDDAAPLTVFSENWLSWMKMVEPDQGARKPIEFGHQAELDVDTWLAQSLARLTLPPARVPESGTAQPNSKDLQKIRRSVAHTLGKLESDEYKRAMVMEMSILDGILRDASSVFRVDFWITESLQPVLHRGSADLGFLLDDWGPSAESLRSEMAGLLAEAVSLTENPAASATLWEPLQDELTDFCRGAEPRTFNPCSEIEPKPLLLPVRASQAGSPRTNKGVDTSSVSNSIGASSQGGGEELGDDEELDTNGMAPPVRILDWDARKFSPKSPVRMERRGAPVPLDEL